MITRRLVLATAEVLAVATAAWVVGPFGCTESSTGIVKACDGVSTNSSFVQEHIHTVCVPLESLRSPPEEGATFTTTPGGTNRHTHTVTLSRGQLVAVQAGQEVVVESSTTDGHTHTFPIVNDQAAAPAPSPTTYFGGSPPR
jgi:hypothetical protein